MNKVVLMGRLTRDPEVRYTQTNNTLVATFSLAIRRRFVREGDNQTADFINCVAWSKTGEFVSKYFKKGQMMEVVGRIQTGSYTNKDGQKVYTTDVVAEDQEFAESKNSASSNAGGYDNGARPEAAGGDFMNIPEGIEEELPFN